MTHKTTTLSALFERDDIDRDLAEEVLTMIQARAGLDGVNESHINTLHAIQFQVVGDYTRREEARHEVEQMREGAREALFQLEKISRGWSEHARRAHLGLTGDLPARFDTIRGQLAEIMESAGLLTD